MRFLSPLIAFGVVLAMAQSSQEVAASASAQEGAVFARSSESPKDISCLPDCVQECFNSKESSRFFRRLRKSAKKFCDKHYRGGWEYKVGKCMKKTCSHYSSDMAAFEGFMQGCGFVEIFSECSLGSAPQDSMSP